MPTLPRSITRRQRSTARPIPSRIDKFIENPTHTQTSMLLSQNDIQLDGGTAAQTIAFGRSVSRLRESSLKKDEPTATEGNDGLPIIGLPAQTRHVTDNLQSHVPPPAPEGKLYVLEPEKFEYGFVEPPKYRLVNDMGKGKSYLQSPAERQQRMLQGKLTQDAKKQLHIDNQKEVRLVSQMQNAFPRGALGSEAPVTEGSVVYEESIKAIDEKAWKSYSVAEARHRDLLGNLSRVQYTKYDPIKDGEAAGPYTAQDKYFQSKVRVEGRDSFRTSNKTHDVRGISAARTMNIRNCQTKGRAYNIISGQGYDHLGPSIPETLEPAHLRKSHPSLNSRACGNL